MSTVFRHLKALNRTVLLASLAVTVGLVGLRFLGVLEPMELDAYDRFIRLKPQEPVDDRVVVVGVDEVDIQTRKEYPLHDGTLAMALEILEDYDPRAIGVDIARDVPQGPPEGRSALRSAVAGSDRIISGCLLSGFNHPGIPPAPGTPPDRVGFTDFPEDIGGVIRRSIMISLPAPPPAVIDKHVCNDSSEDNEVLSLSLLLSLLYLDVEGIEPEQTEWGELKLGDVIFMPLGFQSGGYADTGAFDYQQMLHYRGGTDAIAQVSLTDILEKRVDASQIKGKVVLIGYTSPIANDYLITPYLAASEGVRAMPGVVVHAQMVSQILSAVLDQRPLISSFPELVEVLMIFGWAMGGRVLAYSLKKSSVSLLVLGLSLAGSWAIALLLFMQIGLWLPVVPLTLSLVTTAVSVSLLRQANQLGYTQAIYEQIRDQLQGNVAETQRQSDYLERLVTRAKAIREGREGGASYEQSDMPRAPLPSVSGMGGSSFTPLADHDFQSPEAQTQYDQIKAQVLQDLEQEQAVLATKNSRKKAVQRRQHLNRLLDKAHTTRTQSK